MAPFPVKGALRAGATPLHKPNGVGRGFRPIAMAMRTPAREDDAPSSSVKRAL